MTTSDSSLSSLNLPAPPPDQQAVLDAGGVAGWSEAVNIDTYETGAPDPFPLFLERRVYQGSTGRVYPMPIIDSVSHEKSPRIWQAVHLENEFVRLMLLPELGGRIHFAHDKVAGYDFFYRNNVIKPALVGIGGPWISGGVEFNWPQHHRPATFLPVDWRIEREDDGSAVVWHSDFDQLQRMRAQHGIRLRADSSLVEADVMLHNRRDTTQTFLWWANVAARSHDRYQAFFPDDVEYVADHARRAITAFPAADRPYYGVDYPELDRLKPGADRIDFYGNIPVPTSYMITDTVDAFFGGYDHDADAGFVHWADPAISPGKKLWTWGDGAIGHAWDAQLTDADGPYVELMAGVYTDNQPDFAWLAPGETKSFSQFWYPIHAIGPVRQATAEAAVAVAIDDDAIKVGAIATSKREAVVITVVIGGAEIAQWDTPLGPTAPFQAAVPYTDGISPATGVTVTVREGERVLVEWHLRAKGADEPWAAEEPPLPHEIDSPDELVLTATHLEQYRHPSREPDPYREQVLTQDRDDVRANTGLGASRLKQARYDEAIEHLERATARLQRRNLNPRDGEPHYLLGLALERVGRDTDAAAAFGRARWVQAWAAPAALAHARVALRSGDAREALRLAELANSIPEARRLSVVATRSLGNHNAAMAMLDEMLSADPLDPATNALADKPLGPDPRTRLEVATELARAGAWDVALQATEDPQFPDTTVAFSNPEPLRHYLRALWWEQLGHPRHAQSERAAAKTVTADLTFPAGLDQYDALVAAITADPADSRALGLLGMWLIDAGRNDEAVDALQRAVDAGNGDALTLRNLAVATVRSTQDWDKADALVAQAIETAPSARLLLERDGLARARGLDTEQRLALIEAHRELVDDRDDLTVAYIEMLLDVGRTEEAWTLVSTRRFRPFEGGEGRLIDAYDRALSAHARELRTDNFDAAMALLADGFQIPATLGEGRHPQTRPTERLVLLGDLRAQIGDSAGAKAAWEAACAADPLTVVPPAPTARDYWRGIAHLRLGDTEAAAQAWRSLDERAQELQEAGDVPDYFTTSLPELLVFDTDTAPHRSQLAARLRSLAANGRAQEATRD